MAAEFWICSFEVTILKNIYNFKAQQFMLGPSFGNIKHAISEKSHNTPSPTSKTLKTCSTNGNIRLLQ